MHLYRRESVVEVPIVMLRTRYNEKNLKLLICVALTGRSDICKFTTTLVIHYRSHKRVVELKYFLFYSCKKGNKCEEANSEILSI